MITQVPPTPSSVRSGTVTDVPVSWTVLCVSGHTPPQLPEPPSSQQHSGHAANTEGVTEHTGPETPRQYLCSRVTESTEHVTLGRCQTEEES